MLTRLFNALRGRPSAGDADASDGPDEAPAAPLPPLAGASLPPEAPLPHPSLMVDTWRQ